MLARDLPACLTVYSSRAAREGGEESRAFTRCSATFMTGLLSGLVKRVLTLRRNAQDDDNLPGPFIIYSDRANL